MVKILRSLLSHGIPLRQAEKGLMKMPKWTDAEEKLFFRLCERSPYYRGTQSRCRRYIMALAISMSAFLSIELARHVFEVATYFPAFVSLVICIRYCGRGPAWLSVAASMLGIVWFIDPADNLAIGTEGIPRLLSNFVSMAVVVLSWPRKSFGDLSYRLSAIHRRAMESSKRQKSSSSSSIGRPRVSSRSTISP
jgi:hypothetical protein